MIEGELNGEHLVIFENEEIQNQTALYDVKSEFPGGMAIGILADSLIINDNSEIFTVPFIPMLQEMVEYLDITMEQIRAKMRKIDESDPRYGRVLHFRMPLCLGGSPTDPANIGYMPRGPHPEIVKLHNSIYNRMRAEWKAQ